MLPIFLSIVSAASGYTIAGLYPSVGPEDTVFATRVQPWTQTFYSVAIVQSALITGLMAFRVWQVERRSAKYRTSEGKLMPIIRLLMESAALLLVVEVILLGMYTANYNAQYILLELVAAIVGITIRSTLYISGPFDSQDGSSGQIVSPRSVQPPNSHIPPRRQSIPLHSIAINISHEVQSQRDDLSVRITKVPARIAGKV
ncbi:unnamed protein product [Somion occarium]|uniref:Uncharacterized protein n=1 Tax=Somion occarium TaxID=3059160 RepID=A0ABP1E0F7_9APHY